ncbi:hypothetical protein BT63DRAFT_252192 [Microthyrium microscopicum]|uniref:Uncharacterized protein n=1 Tax=Microthyrium microscopicum TaxID=703497 RepID=A0A6A6UB38_9PEZI|nr:hypothetical protein BT63DRAFT_252192 [Microthyrium microscopicum]
MASDHTLWCCKRTRASSLSVLNIIMALTVYEGYHVGSRNIRTKRRPSNRNSDQRLLAACASRFKVLDLRSILFTLIF